LLQLFITLVMVLMLGLLSGMKFFRIDLTSEKRYTLSKSSKQILRSLDEPVFARISSPHYNASAMDGFAVHSNDTGGALLTSPKVISVFPQTGISGNEQIKAQYVDTGDPLPDWANAVIPIENIEPLDCDGNMSQNIRNPDYIRIRESIAPWRNVRVMGEDIISTELVLPAGHILRPVDLGVVAASGHSTIVVAQKPRVAIIPTGSELIPVGHEVRSGNIIEFNTIISAAQVYDWS